MTPRDVPPRAGTRLLIRLLQVQAIAIRAATTSGTGDRLGPTSNDAEDQSPIADLLAKADRGEAAPGEPAATPRGVGPGRVINVERDLAARL